MIEAPPGAGFFTTHTVAGLAAGLRAGRLTPVDLVEHAATRSTHAHQPNVGFAGRVFNHAIFRQDQGRAGRALGADRRVPGAVHGVQPFGDPGHHAVLEA